MELVLGLRCCAVTVLRQECLAIAMRLAQEGDTDAYRWLLRECMLIAARMAQARGVRGEAGDDTVQDTLLTIHSALASFDSARPLLPWLSIITQRRAIDQLR
jgi:DNA-directed RNA polymerase specialized sigma24 family protein